MPLHGWYLQPLPYSPCQKSYRSTPKPTSSGNKHPVFGFRECACDLVRSEVVGTTMMNACPAASRESRPYWVPSASCPTVIAPLSQHSTSVPHHFIIALGALLSGTRSSPASPRAPDGVWNAWHRMVPEVHDHWSILHYICNNSGESAWYSDPLWLV